MRKVIGAVFVMVLAVSLVLVSSPVLAGDPDACPEPCLDELVEKAAPCDTTGTCAGPCACDCPTACELGSCAGGGFPVCEWNPVKWWDNENSRRLYLCHWGRTPVTAMSRLAGLCGPPNICKTAALMEPGIPLDPVLSDCALGSGRYVTDDPNMCTMGGCAHCRVTQEGFLAGCSEMLNCTDSLSDSACGCLCMDAEDPACPEEPIAEPYCAKCGMCWGVSLAFANKSWAACDAQYLNLGEIPRINNEHPNHFGNSCGGACNWGGDWGISGCNHTECVARTWCLQDNLCATCGPDWVAPTCPTELCPPWSPPDYVYLTPNIRFILDKLD